ncbi:MAG TPA: FeoA family protein [Saprospiraceae bacterium]|jgi:Fe2+ transport system protein FeoA|nr:FeoA family protein [Saprospiraceae bacterium]HNT19957.1 FeoA family protein [Saprospiraceae bacterium]
MFKPILAKNLREIKYGKVVGFSDESISKLLISKGIIIGSLATLVRESPFGQTYYVKIDGLRFGLRKEELDVIQVTETEAQISS